MKQPDWKHRPHYFEYVCILVLILLLLLLPLYLLTLGQPAVIFPNISNAIDATP